MHDLEVHRLINRTQYGKVEDLQVTPAEIANVYQILLIEPSMGVSDDTHCHDKLSDAILRPR